MSLLADRYSDKEVNMSYKIDIQNAVLKLEGGAFQNLCDEFLNECGYNNIVSLGSKPGTNKTTSGTPDTYYCIDSNGKYIFIEYTTQQESIYNKISSSCHNYNLSATAKRKVQKMHIL